MTANTRFVSAFTHVFDRYVKQEPDPSEILACIVAMGTNMGLGKMAEVSGLSHSSMMTTARNYLRLETLHATNDAITLHPVIGIYTRKWVHWLELDTRMNIAIF